MNALHFNIRKAQESDIDAITTLHSTIIEKFVPTIVPTFCKYSDISVTREEEEKVIREMIEDPDHDIVVASIENKIVGFLSVVTETCSDDLIQAPYSDLEYIEVDPQYQGKGIGKTLMKEAEKIAQAKGHSLLSLQVWETNINAKSLYLKNGFQPIIHTMIKKI
jgi:ribosomal protein S18 acetylase RimI-like enzyme